MTSTVITTLATVITVVADKQQNINHTFTVIQNFMPAGTNHPIQLQQIAMMSYLQLFTRYDKS